MLCLQTLGFSVRTCKTLSTPKGKQRCGNSPERANRIIAGHIVKRFFVLKGRNASPCIRDDCVNWSSLFCYTKYCLRTSTNHDMARPCANLSSSFRRMTLRPGSQSSKSLLVGNSCRHGMTSSTAAVQR